jgi:hypothetical protein
LKGELESQETRIKEEESILEGAIRGVARKTYDKSNRNWLNIMLHNYFRARNQFDLLLTSLDRRQPRPRMSCAQTGCGNYG